MPRLLFAALWLLIASPAVAADPVTIDVSDKADGDYPVILVVKGGQVIDARPLKSIRLSGVPTPTPSPTPNPPPGQPTPFEAEVERQTKAVLSAGGTVTTAAAFCEAYFIVGGGAADGTIDHKRSIEAANFASRHIVLTAGDGAHWIGLELFIRNELQVLDSKGALQTKEDYAKVLKAVASSISRGSGYTPVGKALLQDVSTPTKAAAARKAFGILDTIDLVRLMEFIEFIVRLFALFGPK